MTEISTNLLACLLWAQTPFESMSSHFRSERAKWGVDDYVIGGLLVVSVVGAMWLLHRQATRTDRVHRHNSPRALFRRLCREHGLSFASRRLLAQLARHHRLEHPARLFLESDRFELSALNPRLRRQAGRLDAIRATLFAEPQGAAALSTLAGYATGIDLPAEEPREARSPK